MNVLSNGFFVLLELLSIQKPSLNRPPMLWIAAIIIGCCLNNVVLELIIKYVKLALSNINQKALTFVRQDPGAGSLMTFIQFSAVSFISLKSQIQFRDSTGKFSPRITRKVPFTWYIVLTVIIWAQSVANNKAFEYGISMPVNIVFRSFSLFVTFLVGKMLGKSYVYKALNYSNLSTYRF